MPMAVLLIVLASCSDAAPRTALAGSDYFFPTWHPTGISFMAALSQLPLTARDGCLVLGDGRALPIWNDREFSLIDEDPPRVAYSGGEIRVGEVVRLESGEVPVGWVEETLGSSLPERCQAPTYLQVSFVQQGSP
jgi:hypothetical protein